MKIIISVFLWLLFSVALPYFGIFVDPSAQFVIRNICIFLVPKLLKLLKKQIKKLVG
jgi:hypothetical protein